ncbi:hypothetical protein IWQ60_000687 [Tieghemiomyces parasiticus]|uniref:BHLH domain-containing protein n=1 Tax=Tieghemiomyces parasiticus TaxID=78921 RepID=A0A9W8AMC1_9FUNG|nr:hypothetical protein IWQ60_000687 [Tieghemiomyces parasiticus]
MSSSPLSSASALYSSEPFLSEFDTIQSYTLDGASVQTPTKKHRSSSADRRANHNRTERTRRELLNGDFDLLSREIPKLHGVRKPSKSQTVQAAAKYMRQLKHRLQLQETAIRRLQLDGQDLHRQANEYRNQLGLRPLSPLQIIPELDTAMNLDNIPSDASHHVTPTGVAPVTLSPPHYSESDGEEHSSRPQSTTASVSLLTVSPPVDYGCPATVGAMVSSLGSHASPEAATAAAVPMVGSGPPSLTLDPNVFLNNILGIPTSSPLSPHSPLGFGRLGFNLGLATTQAMVPPTLEFALAHSHPQRPIPLHQQPTPLPSAVNQHWGGTVPVPSSGIMPTGLALPLNNTHLVSPNFVAAPPFHSGSLPNLNGLGRPDSNRPSYLH